MTPPGEKVKPQGQKPDNRLKPYPDYFGLRIWTPDSGGSEARWAATILPSGSGANVFRKLSEKPIFSFPDSFGDRSSAGKPGRTFFKKCGHAFAKIFRTARFKLAFGLKREMGIEVV